MMDLQFVDIIARVLLALVLGLLLGLERIHQHKTIGMRVYSLVAMASCLFVLIAQMFAVDTGASSGEIIKVVGQVVTGVGFLGAGVILHYEKIVQNITTAAALWVAAGVGVACALGYYQEAALVTGLTLILIEGLARVEKYLLVKWGGKVIES
jgi:putative Mg2+ transporter-C (MgtC) family protein